MATGTASARRFGDAVVRELETVAPGIGKLVVARQVLTPLDLERDYGLTGGHPLHAEPGLDQFFLWRPLLGHARYRLALSGCTSAAPAPIRAAASPAAPARTPPARSSRTSAVVEHPAGCHDTAVTPRRRGSRLTGHCVSPSIRRRPHGHRVPTGADARPRRAIYRPQAQAVPPHRRLETLVELPDATGVWFASGVIADPDGFTRLRRGQHDRAAIWTSRDGNSWASAALPGGFGFPSDAAASATATVLLGAGSTSLHPPVPARPCGAGGARRPRPWNAGAAFDEPLFLRRVAWPTSPQHAMRSRLWAWAPATSRSPGSRMTA